MTFGTCRYCGQVVNLDYEKETQAEADIAAYDMALDFIGCEIDAEYFQKQEQRFEEHTAQQRLFL